MPDEDEDDNNETIELSPNTRAALAELSTTAEEPEWAPRDTIEVHLPPEAYLTE